MNIFKYYSSISFKSFKNYNKKKNGKKNYKSTKIYTLSIKCLNKS